MSQTVPAACAACDSHLVAWAYDEVAGVPADCVAHLESCERCADELASLKSTRLSMALGLETPSEGLDLRILAAFDAHQEAPALVRAPRRRSRWAPSMAAAAGLSMVAVATVFFADDTPHARDDRFLESMAPEPTLKAAPEVATQEPLPPSASGAVRMEAQERVAQQKAKPPAPAPAPAPEFDSVNEAPRITKMTRRSLQLPPLPVQKGKRAAKPSQKKADLAPAPRPASPAPVPTPAQDGWTERQTAGGLDSELALEDSGALEATAEAKRQVVAREQESTARPDRTQRNFRSGDSALDAADEAARKGEYERATELYARVVEASDSSEWLVSRALVGQARALLALKRFDEAAAVAHQLAADSDVRAALVAEIGRAVEVDAQREPRAVPASVP